jgi:hypothetical protein
LFTLSGIAGAGSKLEQSRVRLKFNRHSVIVCKGVKQIRKARLPFRAAKTSTLPAGQAGIGWIPVG